MLIRRQKLLNYFNLLRKNAIVKQNGRLWAKEKRRTRKLQVFRDWWFEVSSRHDIMQFKQYTEQKLFRNCYKALRDFVVYSD